jgi:hypothetical protein
MAEAAIPTVGRDVHYVLPNGERKGEHRAAKVTGVDGTAVNLTVFADQADDRPEGLGDGFMFRAVSVPFDESARFGTWHWPERARAGDK